MGFNRVLMKQQRPQASTKKTWEVCRIGFGPALFFPFCWLCSASAMRREGPVPEPTDAPNQGLSHAHRAPRKLLAERPGPSLLR